MVLSNEKLKQRLRAEASRSEKDVFPSPVKHELTPMLNNKREKKRKRQQQLDTSSVGQYESPDTPVIAKAELDVYHRCIETILHKEDSGPSPAQSQYQEEGLVEEGLVPRYAQKLQGKDTEVANLEQVVANGGDATTPKSRKRKKALGPIARPEKQEEETNEQSQVRPKFASNEYIASEGDNSSLALPKSKSRKQKKGWNVGANTEKQNEKDDCYREEDQDSSKLRTVYVGGIPYYSSEDDIRAFFGDCGTICEVNLKTFSDTGKFRGIALITLKTVGGAQRALALDGESMGDRFLKIQPSETKPKAPAKKEVFNAPPVKMQGYLRAYIGNLSWSVTEEDIRDFFKGCEIDEVKFSEDKVTGKFRGFGHVDFANDESLERALQLDQELLLERPIKVAYAVPNRAEKRVNTPNRDRKEVTCHTCGEKGHVSFRCPYMGRG